MLKSSNLTFRYPSGQTFSFPDVSCQREEQLLLLGESGTGKTTLLHLLAGMLRPSGGLVEIDGKNITRLRSGEIDRFRGSRVGIIFQTAHFVQSLSVKDNLILPQYLTGKASNPARANELLKRMGLEHKLNSSTKELSIGEQQRVAIARALMNNPAVVLADEPTSALDDKNANQVIELLEEQTALTGAALIIVTHDQRLKDRFRKRITL